MIVFDQVDIDSSNQYVVQYGRLDFGSSGGFVPMPTEFHKNLIIGFVDFTASITTSSIIFVLDFMTVNSTVGVLMNPSISTNAGYAVLTRFGFNYLYIKTWTCNVSSTFFNPANNMCEDCTIVGCLNCTSLSQCNICDASNNYMLSPVDKLCYICNLTFCLVCANSTQCYTCDSLAGASLDNATGQCIQLIVPTICGDNIFQTP